MIGGAHVATVGQIQASALDAFASEAARGWIRPETPVLTIESVFADSAQTLTDWARDAREDS